MTSVRLIAYRLLFSSDTAPTKMSVAFASIVWGLILIVTNHLDFSHVIDDSMIQTSVAVMLAMYGVGLIWRVFDTVHRMRISCVITFIGAALWIWMTWAMIFAGALIPEILAANIAVAAAACWLFIRAGSGEIITNNERQVCVAKELELCEYFIINDHIKEKEEE